MSAEQASKHREPQGEEDARNPEHVDNAVGAGPSRIVKGFPLAIRDESPGCRDRSKSQANLPSCRARTRFGNAVHASRLGRATAPISAIRPSLSIAARRRSCRARGVWNLLIGRSLHPLQCTAVVDPQAMRHLWLTVHEGDQPFSLPGSGAPSRNASYSARTSSSTSGGWLLYRASVRSRFGPEIQYSSPLSRS